MKSLNTPITSTADDVVVVVVCRRLKFATRSGSKIISYTHSLFTLGTLGKYELVR